MNMVMNIGMWKNLQIAFDYKKWQKFINVIENAKIACELSNFIIEDHIT